MKTNAIIEWSATLLSLAFLLGIIKRKAWAWPLGTLSSVLSVFLFFRIGLYAETGLYAVYAVMGCYGWVLWNRVSTHESVALVDYPWSKQWWVLLGIPTALVLGYFINTLPGVSLAYYDAFTSVFALIATWQETRRIRTSFHYWIPLNIASIFLYGSKGLWIYAGLMIIYSIMSVVGYLNWRK